MVPHGGVVVVHRIVMVHHSGASWWCIVVVHRGGASWWCIVLVHHGVASWWCITTSW